MATLTELVAIYKECGEGFDEIARRMSKLVYDFPAGYRGFDEDDSGEFLLFMYPKFHRFLENFHPSGKPFENYFRRCLRWQVKTYATRMRSRRARYTAEKCPGLWPDGCVYGEEEVRESETLYGPGFFEHADEKPSVADPVRRRMVVLALRGCTGMDDRQLRETAKRMGISPPWLVAQRDRLEERLRKKTPRIDILRQRRNAAFATMVELQGELSRCIDPRRRAKLAYRLRVHRKRLEGARLLLSRVPWRPTNEEIAQILGIPTGSVASTLYYLRNQGGFRHTRRHDGATSGNKQSTQKTRVRANLSRSPHSSAGRPGNLVLPRGDRNELPRERPGKSDGAPEPAAGGGIRGDGGCR